MTRFTLLGGAGFVGRSLVFHLKSAGYDVLVPGREADLRDMGNLGQVIYSIGLTGDFRQRALGTMQAHVSKLGEVMMDGQYDSLLYLSSTRVYAGSESTGEDTAIQCQPGDPDHLYNISKLAGEALCLSGGDRHRVARLSNVIGPVDEMSDAFVSSLFADARKGTLHLRTHPRSEKDYIWIGDCVALLEKIALQGRHEIYNVASGVQTHAKFWLDHVSSVTSCRATVSPEADLSSFPKIDISRIKSEFGFKAASPDEFCNRVV